MSFGFSVGDFIALVHLTTRTYQGWKKACGEYTDITQELDNLNVILSRAATEIQAPSSLLLHQDRDLGQLRALTSSCTAIVSQLEAIVLSYGGLSKSRRSTWDRIRLGQQNLTGLRVKLILQINTLGTYLDIVGISAIGRVENNVREVPKMIKVIDYLAAEIRAGRREGSAMTTYENDEKEVWRQFRRELIAEGFSSEDLKKSRDRLRTYIKKIAEAGLLDEDIPNEHDDVPFVIEGLHPHATVVCKAQPLAPNLKQLSQPDFNHAIGLEVKAASDRPPDTNGAGLSDNLPRSSEGAEQEYKVRSPNASESSSEEDLPLRVISNDNADASKEQFKPVAMLVSPRSLLRSSEYIDVNPITSHEHKHGQRRGPELIGMMNVAEGDQNTIEERNRKQAQGDYKTNAAVSTSPRNHVASDEVLGSIAGIYQQKEQTNNVQGRGTYQDLDPECSHTLPRKNVQDKSAGQDVSTIRSQSSTSHHLWSEVEIERSSRNELHRKAKRSTDRTHDPTYNPPYPDRLRRKKGREFVERDVLSNSRNCLRKANSTEEDISVERSRVRGELDPECLFMRSEAKKELGHEKSRGNDEYSGHEKVKNARKHTTDGKGRKDELGRSISRGLEEDEKCHSPENRDHERDLHDASLSPQYRAPSRPSSRQVSTRDKRRKKAYKETTHSSPYYEELEVRTKTPPTYPSESSRRNPRLRRASTASLAELLTTRSESNQPPCEHTPTSKFDIARGATATPSNVLPPPKDDIPLPKRKHSLSKYSRLLSPKLESSLPKRKFSLPGLAFPKRESEEPQLRTVRSSRSYVDSRLASTPSPFRR